MSAIFEDGDNGNRNKLISILSHIIHTLIVSPRAIFNRNVCQFWQPSFCVTHARRASVGVYGPMLNVLLIIPAQHMHLLT